MGGYLEGLEAEIDRQQEHIARLERKLEAQHRELTDLNIASLNFAIETLLSAFDGIDQNSGVIIFKAKYEEVLFQLLSLSFQKGWNTVAQFKFDDGRDVYSNQSP